MEIVNPSPSPETLPLLVTAEQVADASNGEIAEDDSRLSAACAGASDAIRRKCGWHVVPMVRETVKVDYEGGKVVDLPSQHVIDVEAVAVRGVPVDADWSESGLLELASQSRRGYRAVEVTFVHGYPECADLTALASKIVLHSLASPMGATREQAGEFARSYGNSVGSLWSEGDLETLAPYMLQHHP